MIAPALRDRIKIMHHRRETWIQLLAPANSVCWFCLQSPSHRSFKLGKHACYCCPRQPEKHEPTHFAQLCSGLATLKKLSPLTDWTLLAALTS